MSDDKVIKLGEKRKKIKKEKAENFEEEFDGTGAKQVEYCSFCGRPNYMVPKMVLGPGVNICSECTLIAVQYLIMSERVPTEEVQKIVDLLWRADKK